jgi:urea transport system ATP-binding protein
MFEVHNLSAAYGQSEVLHAIDLSARAGEIVVLVGRNGMGKSTLMKSLIGVMPARSGQIVVDGADVAGLPSYQRVARGLAYVPQGRQIFGTMTVKENIETGLVVTGKSEIPSEIFDLFPGRFRQPARRQPFRRPAATIGHCAGARQRSKGAAAGRADRRHPALDHQGLSARAA